MELPSQASLEDNKQLLRELAFRGQLKEIRDLMKAECSPPELVEEVIVGASEGGQIDLLQEFLEHEDHFIETPYLAFQRGTPEAKQIISEFTLRNPPAQIVCLKRSKGQIVQDADVYIGRALFRGGWELRKSKWANPFSVKKYGSGERVIELYEEYVRGRSDLMGDLGELKGKILGCWCKPNPCHGDVLIQLLDESMLQGKFLD